MLRFFFSFLLLLLCWGTPILAHDAFYPHHREDFENMSRRRELRTIVLLARLLFSVFLGQSSMLPCEEAQMIVMLTKLMQKRFKNTWNMPQIEQ